ncbi:Uncharacterised protein [Mycobacteroides abscessus]|nr:Uncharacterised protein [Mycobacteroides abscessus]
MRRTTRLRPEWSTTSIIVWSATWSTTRYASARTTPSSSSIPCRNLFATLPATLPRTVTR